MNCYFAYHSIKKLLLLLLFCNANLIFSIYILWVNIWDRRKKTLSAMGWSVQKQAMSALRCINALKIEWKPQNNINNNRMKILFWRDRYRPISFIIYSLYKVLLSVVLRLQMNQTQFHCPEKIRFFINFYYCIVLIFLLFLYLFSTNPLYYCTYQECFSPWRIVICLPI